MDKKEFFLKKADLQARELETKIEKAKLEIEQKKGELKAQYEKQASMLDEGILKMEAHLSTMKLDTEAMKNVGEAEWDAKALEFETKHKSTSVFDDITEKTKEAFESVSKKFTDLFN